jgi:DnaJ-class molecular chaperone
MSPPKTHEEPCADCQGEGISWETGEDCESCGGTGCIELPDETDEEER